MPDGRQTSPLYIDLRTDRQVSSISAFSSVDNEQNTYVLSEHVLEMVWRESSLDGGWSVEMKFSDQESDRWRDLLLALQGVTAELRIRTKVDGEYQQTDWVPFYVDASSVSPSTFSVIGKVIFLDARYRMMMKTRRRAWIDQSITDILTKLAEEYGLDFDAGGELSDQASSRWQCGITDWDFIRGSLLPEAYAGGRGDVLMWLDSGKLRVHTIDYGSRPSRFFGLNLRGDSRVKSFNVLSRLSRANRRGGGRAISSSLFYGSKDFASYDVGEDKRSGTPALASKLPLNTDDYVKHIASFQDTDSELTGTALHRWACHSQTAFFATISVQLDLLVRPGAIVQIAVDPPGKNGPFDGRYAVLEVQHHMTSYTTVITLARRETSYGLNQAESSIPSGAESLDDYPTDGSVPSVIRRTVEPL